MPTESFEPTPEGDPLAATIEWYSRNARGYTEKIAAFTPEQMSAFISTLPVHGNVLDLGCAGGRDSALLHNHGFHVRGMDVSPGMIEEARRSHPGIPFEIADIRNLQSVPTNSQDGIWARAVLLHMETEADVRAALNEFSRVLRTGGALHIHVKAQTGPTETEVVVDRLTGAARFFRYFTRERLSQLLRETGFEDNLTQYAQDERGLQWISGIVRKVK